MRARPTVRVARTDASVRRAARSRWMFVVGLGLFCVLDVAWIAVHARPSTPPAPIPTVVAAPAIAPPAAQPGTTSSEPAADTSPSSSPPAKHAGKHGRVAPAGVL